MDKAITTTFLAIASVVAAVLVFNALYPAVVQGSTAMTAMQDRVSERLKSQVDIIHAAGELDQNGAWQDTNGDGDFDVFIWVKNVGSLRISAISRIDLFFGPEGNFARIPYIDEASGSYPRWEWALENDTQWNPTATLKITIHYSSILASQRYFVKVVVSSGVSDQYYFSM